MLAEGTPPVCCRIFLEALQQLETDHHKASAAFLDKSREMLSVQATAHWPCNLVKEVMHLHPLVLMLCLLSAA